MVTFFTEGVQYYTQFQNLLCDTLTTSLAPKEPVKQKTKEGAKRTTVHLTPLLTHQSMIAILLKIKKLGITISLPKETPREKDIKEAIFVRTMRIDMWSSAARICHYSLKGSKVQVSAPSDVVRISLLGELLIHHMVKHSSGLHIVIAPFSLIHGLTAIVKQEAILQGMHTALLLNKNPLDGDFGSISSDIRHDLRWYPQQSPQENREWLGCRLSLLGTYEADDFARSFFLLSTALVKHLKPLAIHHLQGIEQYILGPEDEEDIFEGIKASLEKAEKCLPKDLSSYTNSDPRVRFKEKLNQAKQLLEQDAVPFRQIIEAINSCFKEVKVLLSDQQHTYIVLAQLALTSSLLTVDPRRFPIQKFDDYPTGAGIKNLLHFSHTQIHAHNSETALPHGLFSKSQGTSVVLITTPKALELGKVPLGAIWRSPLRSLHLLSSEKSENGHWQKTLEVAKEYLKDAPACAVSCFTHVQDPTLLGTTWTAWHILDNRG